MRKTLFIYITQPNQEPVGWLLRDGTGPNSQAETQQPGWPPAHVAKNNRVVVILGAEHCLCMPAQFPGRKNLNAWRKAAPWILEDQLAEDSSELHYAISPEAEPNGKHLVAACKLEPLQQLLETMQAQQLEADCITPDASLLPSSESQAQVSANLGDRTLLKNQDGACALASSAAQVLLTEQEHWLDSGNALAALDALSAEWDPLSSLNLRQGDLAPGEAMAARLRPWRLPAIAAAITAIIWSSVTAIQVGELKRENQRISDEMRTVFQQALPGAKMVKPRTQIQQALNAGQGANSGGFLLALQTATAPLANIPDAKLSSLDQRGSSLVLNLNASQISTVDKVRAAMNKLPGYQAEVGSVRADTDTVQLRVTIRPAAS